MKLIFVRHGEPRREDYNLTEKGIKQTEYLGEYLKEENICKMYMGSFGRSVYTGEILNIFLKIPFENKKWLNEFKYLVKVNETQEQYPWEIKPNLWINDKEALSPIDISNHRIYGDDKLKKEYENVWKNFDEILEKYGYKRENNLYKVVSANEKTIIIVSHFATISVILSHLLNIPLSIALNMFWIAPSAYVKLVTEEVEKGEAIFRCCEYGGVSHLKDNDNLKSAYGLQNEIK
ncbi:histidine phosphatase family protein [Cetobacterium sp.]|uniref:histidine phosphatase family protein n=1 Tax=Cetobacterium sp. TaxID=2071632 RepID=UPI003EE7AB52